MSGTCVVKNKVVDGVLDHHGPAVFKSYRGTTLHADVSPQRREGCYATLLAQAGIQPVAAGGSARFYFTDAVVMITGEPASYGKLVKRVLIIHRDCYEAVLGRYHLDGGDIRFKRAASPECQDESLLLDWLHADQLKWLNDHSVRYDVFELHVGDAYLLPAGCLHFFYNVEPSPVHSCVGFNVRVERPQDKQ
jgi:hypothetical protein